MQIFSRLGNHDKPSDNRNILSSKYHYLDSLILSAGNAQENLLDATKYVDLIHTLVA